ncbi:uncharacterized protein C21orf62 homolog isoform X2 [Eubalaena glacialis]|uniref:uncharacterized protein C21orf62 homolog isoform X2 n=1 Tax=Eubalaena glacialis TaxID=27606 RepID=UPI002A59A3CD|nr:uncharacterized protein C21orf62 homolog isoform X2 [Eubalaena glacialis]
MAPPSVCSLLVIGALGVFALDCSARAQQNSTLIFTKENTTRKCSCSADIRDCDYSLANLMCSCKTVLPLAVEQSSYNDHLTIWFTDTSALGLLLNFTLVRDLKLSLCSTNILPTEYLAICGLKRLRISTEAKHPSPEQSLLIHDGGERESREKPMWLHQGWQTCKADNQMNGLVFCCWERFPSLLPSCLRLIGAIMLLSPLQMMPAHHVEPYVF